MPLSPADVVGRWVYSHDEGDLRVFGPRAAARPGRAPREAFDLNADGTFRRFSSGPGDAPVGSDGRWTLSGRRLELNSDDARPLSFEVIAAGAGVLKLRPS